MRKIMTLAAAVAMSTAMVMPVKALDIDRMVGTWQWKDFVVTCAKGGEFGLSCKVSKGPKNVGMEMLLSKIVDKGGREYIAKVRHPANGKVYNTRLTMPRDDAWELDGCTTDGACATGIFTRVK